MSVANSKSEVLRKIGRNMLLFQQVEQMLKFLITNGTLSSDASELLKKREQQAQSVKKQTMGQLVGKFLENLYPEYEHAKQDYDGPGEPHISIKLRVEDGLASYEARKVALASIVADRNDLIHHLLPKFIPNSKESCLETGQYLDRQRDELLPEIELLRSQIVTLQEGIKVMAESLDRSAEESR